MSSKHIKQEKGKPGNEAIRSPLCIVSMYMHFIKVLLFTFEDFYCFSEHIYIVGS